MCAIGGQVGCFPQENQPYNDPYGKFRERMHKNAGYPDSPRWPDIPTHNNELWDGNTKDSVQDAGVTATAGSGTSPEEAENFKEAIENALKAIPQVVNKLCDACCTSVKIVVEVEDKPDVTSAVNKVTKDLGWPGIKVGKNKEIYDCP